MLRVPRTFLQAAYVMQDDILFAFMTVRETLMMACHFHLGFSLSVVG